jgi:hypothetical protein
MKKPSFSLLIVSTVFSIVMITQAFGAGKKKKPTPPERHDKVISAVIGNAITVTDETTTRTFTITQFTEINVNGQRATIADLKPGMTVSVTIGMDPSHAGRVNATGDPGGHDKKKD